MDYDEDIELPVSVKAAPSDGAGAVDYAIAALLSAVATGLMLLWAFPGIMPEAWEDVAVAAGLRPAAAVAPGLWHHIAAGLFRGIGLQPGILVLKVLGPVAVGLCAGMAYLLFRAILSLSSRLRLQYSPQRFLIVRLASLLGGLFFACSDPVWRVGQIFSPDTLMMFLSVFGALLFFSFLQRGRLASAYGAMLVLGVLSAETPAGFLLVAFCWGVYFLAVRHVLSLDMPLLNPFVGQITKWHMTFLYAFGFFSTIALDCYGFASREGLIAAGITRGDLPVAYVLRMWHIFISAASPLGWIIASGIIALPCVVSAVLLPRAVDEEQFLPYHIGAIFFATALVSYSQLSALDPLWMWTWVSNPPMFGSGYLLCMLMLAAAATVSFGLVVVGVDTFCRNHRRLAMQMFAEIQMDEGDDQLLVAKQFRGTLRRIGLFAMPLVLAAGVVPGRWLSAPREMAELLNDYVREVCDECGEAKWLFTDGVFDSAVEIAAAIQGRRIYALSMTAGDSPRETWLRMRGGVDREDALAMRCGAAATLRTWVRDKPGKLASSALQLGLDLWRRDGRTPPPCSGVLCRPDGMDDAARAKGVAAAHDLARRILDLYRRRRVSPTAGAAANRLFRFAQWRLSRMMRFRAEHADLEGRAQEAMEETRLADELDAHNSAVKDIRENMERMRQLMLSRMTPREGLQLALVRADFALARKYAELVLDADPNDANANFGMGMSYFAERQWTRAEVYLRRCLLRSPGEPAVYNNLAVVQLETGRYDAAINSVRKALELAPDSAEIKDTLKQIEEKVRTAAGKDGDAGRRQER